MTSARNIPAIPLRGCDARKIGLNPDSTLIVARTDWLDGASAFHIAADLLAWADGDRDDIRAILLSGELDLKGIIGANGVELMRTSDNATSNAE